MTEWFNCISALVTVAAETEKLPVAIEVGSMGPLNRTLTLLTSCMAPTLLMVGCARAIGPLRPTRAAAKSVFAITLRMELNLCICLPFHLLPSILLFLAHRTAESR